MTKTVSSAAIRKINRESSQTLSSQIEEIIKDGIESGTWLPGTPIPSERELSIMFALSRATVRHAIDRLVSEGLVYRANGKGTYVNESKVKLKALSLAGLSEQIINMGSSPSAKLIGIEQVMANQKINTILKVSENTPLFFIERIIYSNLIPLGLLRSYIPINNCPDLDKLNLSNESLYTIMREKYGIIIHHATETLESTLSNPRESQLLNLVPGSPMFLLCITMFAEKELPIEFVKVLFRGDRIQLSLEM